MKEGQDYSRDLAEIRSMMERSSKFLSLSGLAGVMAGVYALAGAFIAYRFLGFAPEDDRYTAATTGGLPSEFTAIVLLGSAILVLAVGTAVLLSYRKGAKRGESIWNATSKRLLINMGLPLVAGGLLVLVFITKGLIGYIAPLTLLFYGLALFNASAFTYSEIKGLGLLQITLGLISSYFIGYGLLFWAAGFGVVHIIYGVYLHYRYER